jgi:hypothetical protein
MANNRIQIKRSVANATVSGLSNGELAFTQASNTLHIGLPDGSGVLRIGGAQYPGILTNNHALVANTSGGIDTVIVDNAIVKMLTANGSPGSNGQVLVTNGSAIYWGTGTSGANTQIQFNDSGVANATAGFTFNKVSNNLFIDNTVFTTTVNATTVNAASHTVGSLLVANSTGLWTPAGTVNAAIVSIGTDVVANASGVFAVGTVNASTISVGSVVVANSTRLQSNGLAVNSSGAYVTGIVNATAFDAGSIGTGAGGTVQNTTTFFVGNNTVNTNITSGGIVINGLTTANNSGVFAAGIVNAFAHTVGTDLVANSYGLFAVGAVNASILSVGTDFTANSTKVVFSGSNVDATSATAEFLNVIVQGNTTLGNSTSDEIHVTARVTGNVNPSANTAYDLGSNSLRWREIHAANIHSTSGYFDGSVEIAGDIIVSGNLVTTNVSSVIVSDPMIYLAGNNYSSDLLDIGFAANYHDIAANTNLHTGLFRDASDGGIYKLFTGSQQELSGNNVVNTAANGYTLAILQTFLESGAIVSNNTTLTVTANSTCNVNIVANTLALSTALAGTEGGTGYKTTINQALLVGNSSNGYNRLSLGTSGFVLQSNGSHLVYDYLDGGSF